MPTERQEKKPICQGMKVENMTSLQDKSLHKQRVNANLTNLKKKKRGQKSQGRGEATHSTS